MFVFGPAAVKLGPDGLIHVIGWERGVRVRREFRPGKVRVLVLSESVVAEMRALTGVGAVAIWGGGSLKYMSSWGPDFETLREQIAALGDGRGVEVARHFARRSALTRASLLRFLAGRRRGEAARALLEAARAAEEAAREMASVSGGLEEARRRLLALEARAARAYYRALASVLPPELGFSSRDPRSCDPVNAAVNYANGIVRGIAYLAVAYARLSPVVGYLHAPRGRRPSLVLDLAEEFLVPVAHRAVVASAVKGDLTPSSCREAAGECRLSEPARIAVARRVFGYLNARSRRNPMFSAVDAFFSVAASLRAFLLGKVRRIASYSLLSSFR